MSRALFAYYLSFNRIAISFICYIFVCNHESNMAMVLFCKETSTIGVIILLFFYTTAIDNSVAIKKHYTSIFTCYTLATHSRSRISLQRSIKENHNPCKNSTLILDNVYYTLHFHSFQLLLALKFYTLFRLT